MKSGAVKNFDNVPDKRLACELNARHVDGDLNRAVGDLLPGQRLPAGEFQNMGAQRHNQATFLGNRNEASRRNHARLECVIGPALRSESRVRGEVEFRLVMDADLLVRKRATEFVLQCQSLSN